jgi:hypothetical protein
MTFIDHFKSRTYHFWDFAILVRRGAQGAQGGVRRGAQACAQTCAPEGWCGDLRRGIFKNSGQTKYQDLLNYPISNYFYRGCEF